MSNSIIKGLDRPIILLKPHKVTVTAFDSSNNKINSGGETLIVRVEDHWERGTNMAWTPLASSSSVIGPIPIIGLMTYIGDGTYEYTFTISKFGNATVSIIAGVVEGVKGEYYSNTNFNGVPIIQNSRLVKYLI